MKSVVMEINGRHAVVMNDAGDFMKVKNRNYTVGQRITARSSRFRKARYAAAAAAAAVVLLISGGAYAYYTPYSEVSLDINPSITMQVNCFNKVIGVTAMNEDAGRVLESLDLINDDVGAATDEVVGELSAQGYIDSESEADIMVTVACQDQTRAREMLETAERKIERKAEQLRIRASVFGECVGQELVTRAREYGVSPGKLMLVEKYALSTGDPSSVDVSAWLDKPVKEIVSATKENKKTIQGADSNGNGAKSTAQPSGQTAAPKSNNGNSGNGNGSNPAATPKGNSNGNGSDPAATPKGNNGDSQQNGADKAGPAATPCASPCPSCTSACVPSGDANQNQNGGNNGNGNGNGNS